MTWAIWTPQEHKAPGRPHVRHQASARQTTGSDRASSAQLERVVSGNQAALQRRDGCRLVISTIIHAADAAVRFVRIAVVTPEILAAQRTNVLF
jgi:hypothetical protein